MCRHNWTKAFALLGLLALPLTGSSAGVYEMVLVPCTPGLPLNDCGMKVHAIDGDATFTTTDGQIVSVAPGTTVSVSGSGIISHTVTTESIVNFASAGNPSETTNSVGNGAGAGQTAPIPAGGSNKGSPNADQNSPPVKFTLTEPLIQHISPPLRSAPQNFLSPSRSVSP